MQGTNFCLSGLKGSEEDSWWCSAKSPTILLPFPKFRTATGRAVSHTDGKHGRFENRMVRPRRLVCGNRVSVQPSWMSLLAITLAKSGVEAQENGVVESGPSINWRTSYQQAEEESNKEGKLLLVKVSATWCGPCRQMKQLTFADSRVVDLVRTDFVPLAIDADEQPDLVAGFHVEAYPTTIVVGPDRAVLKRMKGFQSADSLLSTLTSVTKTQPAARSISNYGDAASALEPVNAIKLAFDGYCLVSLLEETRVRKGSSEFVAEHRGQTVCFQSEEHRQRFLAEPEKYWPVADGQCLVGSREGSYVGRGDPRMAVTWRGRIWLFSDRQRQRRFIQTPSYYANEM